MSCRDVVDVIKDSRCLGLVVHEPVAPAIAVDARKAVQTPGAELREQAAQVVRLARRHARGVGRSGGRRRNVARIHTTYDAMRRWRLWIHASIAVHEGGRCRMQSSQGWVGARSGAVVDVGVERCDRRSVARVRRRSGRPHCHAPSCQYLIK